MGVNQAIKNVGKKFIKGGWAIGYREVEEGYGIDLTKGPIFSVILPQKDQWYADPFPVVFANNRFIFAEVMDTKIQQGHIGVMRIGDESERFVPIIKEPFHMSFPNVFLYNNEWYMIPETNKAKQVRLYHAQKFPYEWELDSILIEKKSFVDTAMLRRSESCFLLETFDVDDRSNEYNRFYCFDVQRKKVAEINPINRNYIDRRPGGNFVKSKNGFMHVLQNCDRMYGEYMHMAAVRNFDNSGLDEKECYTIHARDLKCDKKRWYIKTHTYNRWENLETVDLFYLRPSFSM